MGSDEHVPKTCALAGYASGAKNVLLNYYNKIMQKVNKKVLHSIIKKQTPYKGIGC